METTPDPLNRERDGSKEPVSLEGVARAAGSAPIESGVSECQASDKPKPPATGIGVLDTKADPQEKESISLSKLPRKRPALTKQDRARLRKGKWTLEEEEYTSRIIHYFSTGLLTLPEGSTLRSYLAEKLNCDPMRITKKYAGAACLGRRAYHFRERAQPTIAEIQIAKAQLDELENRFRMRVEEGYTGVSLTPSSSNIMNIPNQAMLAPNQLNAAQVPALLLAMAQNGLLAGFPPVNSGMMAWQNAHQPNGTNCVLPPLGAPGAVQPQNMPSMSGYSMAQLSALALAQNPHLLQQQPQLVTGLPPNLNGFAASQQHMALAGVGHTAGQDQVKSYTEQLRQAYEGQLKQCNTSSGMITVPHQDQNSSVPHASARVPPVTGHIENPVHSTARKPRTAEDKAAGTILLGFLSSLRQSYLDAVREKQNEEETRTNTGAVSLGSVPCTDVSNAGTVQTVTDSSSSQNGSEDSDWISDKKSDSTFGEESDKEVFGTSQIQQDNDNSEAGRAPPRKRHKQA